MREPTDQEFMNEINRIKLGAKHGLEVAFGNEPIQISFIVAGLGSLTVDFIMRHERSDEMLEDYIKTLRMDYQTRKGR